MLWNMAIFSKLSTKNKNIIWISIANYDYIPIAEQQYKPVFGSLTSPKHDLDVITKFAESIGLTIISYE